MTAPKPTAESISTKLLRVKERAKRDPEVQFRSLAHLLDVDALRRAYQRLRNRAAPGEDGVTKEDYGEQLEDNLRDLHQRLRKGQWRHQVIRRVYIPKGKGKTRALGISCLEDKIVQGALREVLEAVYEPLFLDSSYGYRPGRSPHDALRALDGALHQGEAHWILEADLQSYFDSIPIEGLMEWIRTRVADGALLRLIGKCLRVGVLNGEEYSEPEQGTPQGSILSPLLGNIYLHYALDQWFEEEVRPRMHGHVRLIRFADDLVIACEREDDARRVARVLPKRLERFGLRLHPDKTRLLAFGRPRTTDDKGSGTFDFLGFTHYWEKTRRGWWAPRVKTQKDRLRRSLSATEAWCRGHRHLPVKEQASALRRSLNGHYNYFGVNNNRRSLVRLLYRVQRIWRKWLNRRSQQGHMPWTRFKELLQKHPLPKPEVRVQLWARAP